MEYTLITRTVSEIKDHEEFINDVNEKLKQGWELYGPTTVNSYYDPDEEVSAYLRYVEVYAQAMIKR